MGWRRALGQGAVAMASVVAVAHAVPAAAVPVVSNDGTQDVGDRRADISSLSLDQDGAAVVVGVRMVEFADPRTDFFWRNPRASSLVEVKIDRDRDNKPDYIVDFVRAQVGKTTTTTLAVQVFSTTAIAMRCTGSYSLDARGGWIRLGVPKSCIPATAPYRVQVMYSFNRSAERPTLSPVVDFAPDFGRWFPGP